MIQAARLPFVVEPFRQESFLGYVLRLCEANLYETPTWIFELCGGAASKGFSSSVLHQIILGLSALTGIAQAELSRMAPSICLHARSNYVTMFDGARVRVDLYDLNSPKVCPECVEEFGFVRGIWDLAFYVACPRHGRALINWCRGCKNPLSWLRPELNKCRCGHDFREAELVEADEDLLWLMELIEEAATGQSGTLGGKPAEFETPDGVVFEKIIAVAEIFAAHFKGETQRTFVQGLPFTRMALVSMAEILTPTATVLRRWPTSLYEFLEQTLAREVVGAGSIGITGYPTFGWLYRRAFNEDNADRLSILRSGIEGFLSRDQQTICVTKKGQCKAGQRVLQKPQFLTKSEVKHELHISSETFDRLGSQGSLDIRKITSGGQSVYQVPRASVEGYKRANEELIGKADLAARLGISRPLVERMMRFGVLQASVGPALDGAQKWLFHPDSIEALFQHLSQRLKPIYVPEPCYISFGRMYELVARHGYGGDEFIKRLLEGCFVPRRLDSSRHGLDRFQYCLWDVQHSIAVLRGHKDGFFCHISKLRLMLGTQDRYIRTLLRGHANVLPSDGGGYEPRFRSADLVRFAEKFTSYDALLDWMRFYGVDATKASSIIQKGWIGSRTIARGRFFSNAHLHKIFEQLGRG